MKHDNPNPGIEVIHMATDAIKSFIPWLIAGGILVLLFSYFFQRLLRKLDAGRKGRRNRR